MSAVSGKVIGRKNIKYCNNKDLVSALRDCSTPQYISGWLLVWQLEYLECEFETRWDRGQVSLLRVASFCAGMNLTPAYPLSRTPTRGVKGDMVSTVYLKTRVNVTRENSVANISCLFHPMNQNVLHTWNPPLVLASEVQLQVVSRKCSRRICMPVLQLWHFGHVTTCQASSAILVTPTYSTHNSDSMAP